MQSQISNKNEIYPLELLDDDHLFIFIGDVKTEKQTFIALATERDFITNSNAVDRDRMPPYVIVNHPKRPNTRFVFVAIPESAKDHENLAMQKLVEWLKISLRPTYRGTLAFIHCFDTPKGNYEGPISPAKLISVGLDMNLAFIKKPGTVTSPEWLQERGLPNTYNPKIYDLEDTQESAWRIIDNILEVCGETNAPEFRRKIVDVIPPLGPGYLSFQLLRRLWDWLVTTTIGAMQLQIPATRSALDGERKTETETHPMNIQLEPIISRIAQALKDKEERERLLSSQGSDAQALLDTFQLILNSRSTQVSRLDLIIVTRNLISKTGLYPKKFCLEGVQSIAEMPVASGTHADVRRGVFENRVVCLKTIRVYQTSIYEKVLKALVQEAIFWGQLKHENLLPFYGFSRPSRQVSLVFPWADNGDVVSFLKLQPTANRVLLCSDIAHGLAYLHKNNIVYGCLKGTNILVDKNHRAYLGDFGLSALDSPEISDWAAQSVSGPIQASFRWQAPELFAEIGGWSNQNLLGTSAPQNNLATDIYAWSCVCYEIFTDQIPFFEYSQELVVSKNIIAGVRPTLSNALKTRCAARGLTDEMWALMNECWHSQPSKRPTSTQILTHFATAQSSDNRPPGEWPGAHANSDMNSVPLTLEQLDTICGKAVN